MGPRLGDIVARNVRAERAGRHWRQQDLAERLGWERGSVGHMENGRRSIRVSDLPDLCRALDVTFADLLRGADPEDLRTLGL